ncbi:hypothetical protein ACWC09_21985 [Streptomyces sp. NPDC001617]
MTPLITRPGVLSRAAEASEPFEEGVLVGDGDGERRGAAEDEVFSPFMATRPTTIAATATAAAIATIHQRGGFHGGRFGPPLRTSLIAPTSQTALPSRGRASPTGSRFAKPCPALCTPLAAHRFQARQSRAATWEQRETGAFVAADFSTLNCDQQSTAADAAVTPTCC